MLELRERQYATKPRLMRLLEEIGSAGWCRTSLYLTPASLESRLSQGPAAPQSQEDEALEAVIRETGRSEMGLAVFAGEERAVAVAPPFPLSRDLRHNRAETGLLVDLLERRLTVGVVLLRLGRYALGVLEGDSLVASKTDSRYVKGRHKAGGQSQRRFERGREKEIRELYDKTCQMASQVFAPYAQRMDYLLMGGERQTLKGFVQRCRYLQDLRGKTLDRLLQVDRPNQEALKKINVEVWKSRVAFFEYEAAD